MSIASLPSMKLKLSPSPPPKHHPWKPSFITIRGSKAEGPLRRPSAPSLSPPPPPPPPPPPSISPTPPAKPAAGSAQPPAAPPKPVEVSTTAGKAGVVTLEYQRKMAKEMQEYFRQKKLEEADQGPFFGFLGKNEIANGRWAMFGFAVGLLTEYATGSDFVQQLRILLSNFGIVDLD